MIHHGAEEQVLVAVLQRSERDVAIEIGAGAAHAVQDALHLLLLGGHARGQEAVESKHASLLIGERRALVEGRIVEVLELGFGQESHAGTPRSERQEDKSAEV